MKKMILVILLAVTLPLAARTPAKLEMSTGASMLLYQSVFSFQPSFGGMAAVRGTLHNDLDWQAGVRLGSIPGGVEGFARLLAAPKFGAWAPMVGFEVGLTQREQFEQGDKLLRETRRAMEGGISPRLCWRFSGAAVVPARHRLAPQSHGTANRLPSQSSGPHHATASRGRHSGHVF